MIANSPISVKIGKTHYRLGHGQTVPQELENFWRKSRQLEQLEKFNVISNKKGPEEKADVKKADKKVEKVEPEKSVKVSEKDSDDIGEVKE